MVGVVVVDGCEEVTLCVGGKDVGECGARRIMVMRQRVDGGTMHARRGDDVWGKLPGRGLALGA